VAALALAACGSHGAGTTPRDAGVPWAAARIDWSTPPAVPAAGRFVAPPIQTWTTPAGIRVLLVESHRLPIVSVTTLHAAAGSRADGAQPGLAALALDLLDEGAGARTGAELADALEREGARLELAIATDHASAQLVVLSDHLAASLELLADVIRRPAFTDADVTRVRAEHVAELARQRERPRTVAAPIFDRVVFGDHPYAHPASGTPAAVGALGPADLRAFWARAYGPTTTTVIVAGDVSRAVLERLLAHAFADGSAPAARPASPPPLPAEPPPTLAYVDVPGAPETAVLVGRRTPGAGDPPPLAHALANAVLGGTPDSRLEHRLRDELAVTFGIGSSAWRGEWAGTWGIATSVRAPSTAAAIRAVLEIVDSLRTTEIPAAELARARLALTRAAAQGFETTSGTARAVERLVSQDLALDHYATLDARLAAITPAAVRAAAFAQWTGLSIVVVGDWATIGEPLRALGLPLRRYTADGAAAP
jgi:zinc protease